MVNYGKAADFILVRQMHGVELQKIFIKLLQIKSLVKHGLLLVFSWGHAFNILLEGLTDYSVPQKA